MNKTHIKRKDVKDTITAITLPYSMEDWMIERITDYTMLLLRGQRQELNDWVRSKMIDYCYDFAWHYGRLYHIGNAEKIKAAISEKFRLPEEFLSELLSSKNKIRPSAECDHKGFIVKIENSNIQRCDMCGELLTGSSGYTKEQIITMFTSFTQENREDYANQIYEIAKFHFMPNSEQNPERSVATDDDSSNADDQIKTKNNG